MILVLFGPPAAGKGTQASLLSERRGYVHISTGVMLREARSSGTELGRQVAAMMDAGELVSDELVIGLIEAVFDRDGDAVGHIFDGFPRTMPQAEALDALLDRLGKSLDRVVSLQVDDAALLSRVAGRRSEERRSDDDPDILVRRLEAYRRQTEPLLNMYDKRGILTVIDGMARVEDVFVAMESAVGGKSV